MSCLHNERILESLMDEVSEMGNIELAQKVGQPWRAVGFADPDRRAAAEELLVNKMFEQLPDGPQQESIMMDPKTFKLLAEQSIRDGEQRYTEAQIRDMVGAPSIEEENTCLCGEPLDECSEAYVHMTSGC